MTVTEDVSPRRNAERLLIHRQLASEKGIPYSASQLWRLRRAGLFPEAIRISSHKIAWRESDIDRWIAQRPTVGSADDPHAATDRESSRKAVEGKRTKRIGEK